MGSTFDESFDLHIEHVMDDKSMEEKGVMRLDIGSSGAFNIDSDWLSEMNRKKE